MGISIVAEPGCRLGAAGAVHWVLARQDWWPLLWVYRTLVTPFLKSHHTYSEMTWEVTLGSEHRNSSYFGSFYWFCFTSVVTWSQLDSQSNSVSWRFGYNILYILKESGQSVQGFPVGIKACTLVYSLITKILQYIIFFNIRGFISLGQICFPAMFKILLCH